MKRIYLLLGIFFISTICKAYAGLPLGAYVGLKGGYLSNISTSAGVGLSTSSDDNSIFISVSAGARLMRIRGEIEYIKRYNMQKLNFVDGKTKNISNDSIMGNLYYNIFEFPFFRIFVNGGLGKTYYSSKVITNSPTFSYNVGAGATFTLADTASFDVGYRYFNMGKIEISNSKKLNTYSNDLYFSVRFGF